jgi:hypothetical protein
MATRQERKAQRKARRQARKEDRKLKRQKFNEIVEAASTLDLKFDLDTDDPEFVDAFNEIWPVLKPSLEFASISRITGPKADKTIDTIIDLGHRISTGNASRDDEAKFIQSLDTVWSFVNTALGILKTFTNDKTDQVIDQVIEIGDWITDNES